MNEEKKNTQLAVTAKSLFAKDDVKAKFQELLGKKAQGFITSVLQIVNSSNLLKNADPMSIYNAAATAATLDLPINNNLGFAYIVPYNESFKDDQGKWQKRQVAQFQMGYKGFKQLAIRSGQYKTLVAKAVFEGQLVEDGTFLGYHFDWKGKVSEKVIGYASHFELLSGYSSTFYMDIEDMNTHAKKYSQTFKNNTGNWVENFEKMALKTVSKLHLNSGEAPLSIEMQKAIITDQAVVNDYETNDVSYVDNDFEDAEIEIDHEANRTNLMLQDCATIKEVEELVKNNPNIPIELVTARKDELKQAKLL